MLKKLLAVALISVTASMVHAQVRVVESSPQGVRPGVAQSLPGSTEADVYSQIRALQEEIALLRGMVEEQSYELKQLKQLQLDNYMDLDRRIAGDSTRTSTLGDTLEQEAAVTRPKKSVARRTDDSASENDVYKAAYDLLNQRDYDTAVIAFTDYLDRFPDGSYASNSQYWLGKIAMLKKDYPQAKNWFTKLISDFPDAAKTPDAKLDLGKVYFFLGDKVKAKGLLGEVANSDADAARLAQKFIDENYQ